MISHCTATAYVVRTRPRIEGEKLVRGIADKLGQSEQVFHSAPGTPAPTFRGRRGTVANVAAHTQGGLLAGPHLRPAPHFERSLTDAQTKI